jgi:NhaP-type Na+/H+ or K+/H+ antiporter
MIAAGPGFSFADPWAIGLLFLGLAVFVAVGALSHQHERAFSASAIYLAVGVGAAAGLEILGLGWLDPIDDATVFERASEFAVIVALFGTGLKLERELTFRAWSGVSRLLLLAMPLTIAAIAAYGHLVMGLSIGVAVVLGAILAPTDPVLAGDIGVGPPGDEEEREPNFSLTGEAGLNDGLAFPFVLLGVLMATEEGSGWVLEWALADVAYAVAAGLAIGAASGYGIAALAVRLRDRELLAPALDGWLAIAAVLVIYGLTEIAGAYGFLGAFAGGLAFRRYEHGHEYNRRVHDGAEVVEKFSELALVLLLGSALTLTGLGVPGISGWLLIPVALLLVRPATVLLSLVRTSLPPGERAFVAWFGVRGIGSLYYVAFAIAEGGLARNDASTLFWTVAICIVASIVVHGVTASPLSRRWLPPPQRPDGEGRGEERRYSGVT